MDEIIFVILKLTWKSIEKELIELIEFHFIFWFIWFYPIWIVFRNNRDFAKKTKFMTYWNFFPF